MPRKKSPPTSYQQLIQKRSGTGQIHNRPTGTECSYLAEVVCTKCGWIDDKLYKNPGQTYTDNVIQIVVATSDALIFRWKYTYSLPKVTDKVVHVTCPEALRDLVFTVPFVVRWLDEDSFEKTAKHNMRHALDQLFIRSLEAYRQSVDLP